MKINILKPTEINACKVRVALPVRYEEKDIPNDFPLQKGNMWNAVIDIDSGEIEGWPEGAGEREISNMKVCDEGIYEILDGGNKVIATREGGYVPHGLIPGSYGDYVTLNIDAKGKVTNWPSSPDLSGFFDMAEEE